MGRKLVNRETYLQPAEYAEGHLSLHLCVTLDAEADDPASLLSASLVATRLQNQFDQFTCMSICDPKTSRVRLLLDADFRDAEESMWSEDLNEDMEALWDEDGGVEDYGRALSLVREDVMTQLANWLEGRAEELDMNLALSADVSIRDFRIWQK